MSASFRWEIYEASKASLTEQYSGEIQLEKTVEPSAVTWQVDEPDTTLNLVPIKGGIVLGKGELSEKSSTLSQNQGASILKGADESVARLVVLSAVAFLGIGILALLTNKLASGMAGV